jgi:hypothetical protein
LELSFIKQNNLNPLHIVEENANNYNDEVDLDTINNKKDFESNIRRRSLSITGKPVGSLSFWNKVDHSSGKKISNGIVQAY